MHDQLCPVPNSWGAWGDTDSKLASYCRSQGIRLVLLNAGHDTFNVLGRTGHSWAHLLIHPNIFALEGAYSMIELRNAGMGIRVSDSLNYMLAVTAFLICLDRTKIEIGDVLPSPNEDPPPPTDPWH